VGPGASAADYDFEVDFTLDVKDCYWNTARDILTIEDSPVVDVAFRPYIEYTIYLKTARRRLYNAKGDDCNSAAYRVWAEPSVCTDDCECDG
jgi:hypothetical protein